MADPARSSDTGDREPEGPPRWVKVFGIALAALLLLILAMMLISGGEHGPGRHGSSAGPGDVPLAAVQGGGR